MSKSLEIILTYNKITKIVTTCLILIIFNYYLHTQLMEHFVINVKDI